MNPEIDSFSPLTLKALPDTASEGTCFAANPSGADRYVYIFVNGILHRYDRFSDSFQVLPEIPTSNPGAANAMIFDAVRNRIWLFCANGTNPPTWQGYDLASHEWTDYSVVGLNASFGTSAALCLPAWGQTADLPPLDAGTIYLIGDSNAALFAYEIENNTWSTVTVLDPRPGTPEEGCGLFWMPAFDSGKLVSPRGGNTNVIDIFDIASSSWEATGRIALPETHLADTGTAWAHCEALKSTLMRRTSTGEIQRVNIPTLQTAPAGALDITDGTAVQNHALAVCSAHGRFMSFVAKQGATDFRRIDSYA